MTPTTTPTKPQQRTVYILRFRLPVGLSLTKRKMFKNGMAETLWYKFELAKRKKIGQLRAHYRHLAFRYSIPFHGLRLVREDDLEAIEKFAKAAQQEFQKLDSSLMVQATPIPIDLDPNRKGGIEEAIHDAAASHIYNRVLERLQRLAKKGGELPETSRRSLLKLTERLQQWNLLGSEDIDKQLAEMTRQFAVKNIGATLNRLEDEVKKFSSEGAWVEI